MTGVRSHKSLGDLFLGSFCLLLSKIVIVFCHKIPIKKARGAITWQVIIVNVKKNTLGFIPIFIAMFEIVYALIQMHRYRSYAPLKVRKTVGKKKIRGSDLFTIVLYTLIAILAIYKFGFY